MKNTKKNRKGFTLIELLVVIAIIAILAGIVLVSLSSARDRSRRASLQSTLSSIVPVASMCINDGGHVFPAVNNTIGGNPICNGDTDGDGDDTLGIGETWPTLAGITGANYQFIDTVVNQDASPADYQISAGTSAGAEIVQCNVMTGSCNLVPN